MGMRRGEVWWAVLSPPAGARPVVLLSRDDSYPIRSRVTIALVTTRIRGIAPEVSLGSDEGLVKPSVVNLDTLATVNKSRLQRRLGVLSASKVAEVNRAIHFALGLED